MTVGVLVLVAKIGFVKRVSGLAIIGVRDNELEDHWEEERYRECEKVGEDVGGIGRRAIYRFMIRE